MTCALCSFPTPPHDRLLLLGRPVHAACAFEATKRLGVKASVLLKRRIKETTNG